MVEKEIQDEVLTIREVSDRLKVHPYTVYTLLKAGSLTGFKLRRRWRVLSSSLEKFVSRESKLNGEIKK